MKDGKFESEDIYALLLEKFGDGRQWLTAGEVANCTGGGTRRLDFVACNCYESNGLGIHAFEIKISKPDLRRELENPQKHTIFFNEVDTYSIVAPDYVLDAEYVKLVPAKWGVYRAVAGKDGEKAKLVTVRRPIALHDVHDRTIKRSFAFSLIRSMASGMAERNACRAQIHDAYCKGFKEGSENSRYAQYEKMYNEERERGQRNREILSKLGFSWRSQDSDTTVDRYLKAIRLYERLNTVNFRFDSMIEAVQSLRNEFQAAVEGLKKKEDGR